MREDSNRKRTEKLDYIQSMLGQVRKMAEAEKYDMLAYLIEMAYVEANDILQGERPSNIRESTETRRRRDASPAARPDPVPEEP